MKNTLVVKMQSRGQILTPRLKMPLRAGHPKMAKRYFTAVSQTPISLVLQLLRCLTGLRSFGVWCWRGQTVGENGTWWWHDVCMYLKNILAYLVCIKGVAHLTDNFYCQTQFRAYRFAKELTCLLWSRCIGHNPRNTQNSFFDGNLLFWPFPGCRISSELLFLFFCP